MYNDYGKKQTEQTCLIPSYVPERTFFRPSNYHISIRNLPLPNAVSSARSKGQGAAYQRLSIGNEEAIL